MRDPNYYSKKSRRVASGCRCGSSRGGKCACNGGRGCGCGSGQSCKCKRRAVDEAVDPVVPMDRASDWYNWDSYDVPDINYPFIYDNANTNVFTNMYTDLRTGLYNNCPHPSARTMFQPGQPIYPNSYASTCGNPPFPGIPPIVGGARNGSLPVRQSNDDYEYVVVDPGTVFPGATSSRISNPRAPSIRGPRRIVNRPIYENRPNNCSNYGVRRFQDVDSGEIFETVDAPAAIRTKGPYNGCSPY